MEELGLSIANTPPSGTVVHIAKDQTYCGYLVIADEIKPFASEAISSIRHSGIRKTVMLTGDRHETATNIANMCGIDVVHASLLPDDKVQLIEKMLAEKQKTETIAFVGDGINDAPVLMRADVGIAMGALGSDAAVEAADIVLMDDDLRKLPLAIQISRRTMRIAKENILFALVVKLGVLMMVAAGSAGMWLAVFADVGVSLIAVLNGLRAMLK